MSTEVQHEYERGDRVALTLARDYGSVAAWVIEASDPAESLVWVRMIGDDRDFQTDRDNIAPIHDDDFCSGCGQIGCGWG